MCRSRQSKEAMMNDRTYARGKLEELKESLEEQLHIYRALAMDAKNNITIPDITQDGTKALLGEPKAAFFAINKMLSIKDDIVAKQKQILELKAKWGI